MITVAKVLTVGEDDGTITRRTLTMSVDKSNAQVQAFVQAVKENGKLYALSAGDDWVVVDSVEYADTDALPLWSSEEAAAKLCQGEWADYRPAAISLDDFFDQWLESLSEDEVMVGLDWDEELEGPEVDPFDFGKLLADEGL